MRATISFSRLFWCLVTDDKCIDIINQSQGMFRSFLVEMLCFATKVLEQTEIRSV